MRIFTCNSCSRIHLEIGNTQIHFNTRHCLQKYLDNLDSIDTVYYAAINRKKGLSKVIIIPLNNAGTVHLGFTLKEFEELKAMIRNYLTNAPKVFRINTKSYDFQALILN